MPFAPARAVGRAIPRILAALGVWAALGASATGGDTRAGEWRPWCSAEPGGSSSLGWHFYCDREEETADDQAPTSELSVPPTATATAAARIAALRARLEEARAEAILDPTPGKVAGYLALQRDALQRAATFSDAFRRTVWATPELDYTLRRPVGALAKRLWSDERRDEIAESLATLGERYGLIYLGHPDCGGCRVFGPLLRAFAMRHGIDVLAVSMTGGPLEGWPGAVPDNGRAARLGLAGSPVPALVLFDTETKRAMPVGFGVLAEDQIAERIFVLTRLETGHDY